MICLICANQYIDFFVSGGGHVVESHVLVFFSELSFYVCMHVWVQFLDVVFHEEFEFD